MGALRAATRRKAQLCARRPRRAVTAVRDPHRRDRRESDAATRRRAASPARPRRRRRSGALLAASRATSRGVGQRIVTASPDVAVSTNLGGWINRVGVYSPPRQHDYDDDGAAPAALAAESPAGQHIELGISEMNLFMLLGQLGLSYELHRRARCIPIGTVYDPFVCRGLDALIYALYIGRALRLRGHAVRRHARAEGGAHQSTITPSIGIELPGAALLRAGLRAGGRVVAAARRCAAACDRDGDGSLPTCGCRRGRSTRPLAERRPRAARRRASCGAEVLAGGYRAAASRPPGRPRPRSCSRVRRRAAGGAGRRRACSPTRAWPAPCST